MSKLPVVLLILSLAYLIAAAPSPGGRNVCSRRSTCLRTRRASTRVSSQIKGYRRCGWWGWGRCTTYRRGYRIRYYVQYYRGYTTTYACCSGWREDTNGECTIRVIPRPPWK